MTGVLETPPAPAQPYARGHQILAAGIVAMWEDCRDVGFSVTDRVLKKSPDLFSGDTDATSG
jgi:hypothetical protein